MNIRLRRLTLAASAAAVIVASVSAVQAQQRYTLGSLAEGTTPFLVNTAWANAVNKYVPGHKIQVSAVGAATRHSLLVAQGKMDFAMGASSMYNIMYRAIGPFKKIKDGPGTTEKLRALFSYPIGLYHPVVYADSGIKTWADLRGKKVFLGPPAGVATRNTRWIVEAMTGMLPGKGYTQVKMDWGPAATAFQDRKMDVWITVTAAPSPQVQQLTLSNKIRILSLDESKFSHPAWKRYMAQPGRRIDKIDPRIYGKNLVNTDPILSTGAWVGLLVRADMDADLIYKMMKAFWDNLDEAHALSVAMKDTLSLEFAVKAMSGKIHPGALRFYKEKGFTNIKTFMLTEAETKKK